MSDTKQRAEELQEVEFSDVYFCDYCGKEITGKTIYESVTEINEMDKELAWRLYNYLCEDCQNVFKEHLLDYFRGNE